MADITITLPVEDATKSIEVATLTPANVSASMTIKDAFANKNNSLAIVVQATAAGTLTIKKGEEYPNSMLGDLAVGIGVGTNVIHIQDISRFVKRDGDVDLTETGITGTIFVTAKRAGLAPVA